MPVIFEEIVAEIEPEATPTQSQPGQQQAKPTDSKREELRTTLTRIAYRAARLQAD